MRMPKRSSTVLTDTYIKSLKPRAYAYKKADGHTPRLYIVVAPSGVKYFTLSYESPETGKDRFKKLGAYPTTSLADAIHYRMIQLLATLRVGVALPFIVRIAVMYYVCRARIGIG